MAGNQLLLAAVTVSELRYGALVAGWGEARRRRLEEAIGTVGIIPVTDNLSTEVAELRFACRLAAHPLADQPQSATVGWTVCDSARAILTGSITGSWSTGGPVRRK